MFLAGVEVLIFPTEPDSRFYDSSKECSRLEDKAGARGRGAVEQSFKLVHRHFGSARQSCLVNTVWAILLKVE